MTTEPRKIALTASIMLDVVYDVAVAYYGEGSASKLPLYDLLATKACEACRMYVVSPPPTSSSSHVVGTLGMLKLVEAGRFPIFSKRWTSTGWHRIRLIS